MNNFSRGLHSLLEIHNLEKGDHESYISKPVLQPPDHTQQA